MLASTTFEGRAVPEFLTNLGALANVIAVAGFLLAGSTFVRRQLRQLARGKPDQKYATWFVDSYGSYWFPSADGREDRNIEDTYIPLSLSRPDNAGLRPAADDVIRERHTSTVVVLGDAGSGKTTLLTTYGLELARAMLRRERRQVPFLVSARLLASAQNTTSLTAYLR